MRSSCLPAFATDQVWRFGDDEGAVMVLESPEGFGTAFLANSTRCEGWASQRHRPERRDKEKRTHIVSSAVVVPDLAPANRIPHRNEHGLLLDPREHILQPNAKDEPIRHRAHRLKVVRRNLANGLPPIERKPHGDPLLKRQILDPHDSPQALPVLRNLERLDIRVPFPIQRPREVGQLENELARLRRRHRRKRERLGLVLRFRLDGAPASAHRRRPLLSEEVLDVLELSVKVNVFGARRRSGFRARLDAAGGGFVEGR